MKYVYSSIFFLAISTALTTSEGRDGPITLYLEPQAEGAPFAIVYPGDEQLQEQGPVLREALAAEGWMWGEYTADFSVYIADEDIGKDLEPADDARMFLASDPSGPVLARFSADDAIEILDSGPMWSARLINKSVPVYFQQEVSADEEEQEEDLPWTVADSDDAPPEQIQLFDERQPADTRRATEAPQAADGLPRAAGAAEGIAGNFEGTFRRSRSGLFGRTPPAPYELIDGRGRRVAWVDISRVVIPQGIAALLGEEVVVHGGWEQASPRPEIIVRAKNIRPR